MRKRENREHLRANMSIFLGRRGGGSLQTLHSHVSVYAILPCLQFRPSGIAEGRGVAPHVEVSVNPLYGTVRTSNSHCRWSLVDGAIATTVPSSNRTGRGVRYFQDECGSAATRPRHLGAQGARGARAAPTRAAAWLLRRTAPSLPKGRRSPGRAPRGA